MGERQTPDEAVEAVRRWLVERPATRRWATESLVVTDVAIDEFSPAQLMQSFSNWLVFVGEDPPETTKTETLIELTRVVVEAGATFSPYRGTFQGARLV